MKRNGKTGLRNKRKQWSTIGLRETKKSANQTRTKTGFHYIGFKARMENKKENEAVYIKQ